MDRKLNLVLVLILMLIFSVSSFALNPKYKGNSSSSKRSSSSIVPQRPTHFFFMPTLNVNDALGFVISPREISMGLGSGFMMYLSPWNGRIPDAGNWATIGNARAGIKYQMGPDVSLAIGADFADNSSGLGAAAVFNLSQDEFTEIDIIPKGRINIKNMRHQVGIDLGVLKQVNELFSLMLEPGFRLEFYHNDDLDSTFTYGKLELNGGIRIIPPAFPLLYIDLGGNFDITIISDEDNYGGFYIDFGFCFKP